MVSIFSGVIVMAILFGTLKGSEILYLKTDWKRALPLKDNIRPFRTESVSCVL